ncbi:barstar family protein [bacterium]|nr:barstar family protein [bacterium]
MTTPRELEYQRTIVEKLREPDRAAAAEAKAGRLPLPSRTPSAADAAHVVRLDCDRITDWDSFHTVFAEVFGFPEFYGRDMHAWIDCMDWLHDPDGEMTSVTVPYGCALTLQLDGVTAFAARCPEQYAALVECVAFVNWRRTTAGEGAVLALSYFKSH